MQETPVQGKKKRPSRITCDPEVLAGKPVIRGTRLSVDFVLDLMADGWGETDILRQYPGITHDDIMACLAHAGEDVRALWRMRIFVPESLRFSKQADISSESEAKLARQVLVDIASAISAFEGGEPSPFYCAERAKFVAGEMSARELHARVVEYWRRQAP
jgi:uncharacterized protein (DUF433 family)